MTSESLAVSYLKKATTRLKVLAFLLEEGSYSDVVRKAQELVELALKGMCGRSGLSRRRSMTLESFCWSIKAGFLATFGSDCPTLRASQNRCGRTESWRFTVILILSRQKNIRSWKRSGHTKDRRSCSM